jgi:hypothetical protein
MLLVLDIKTVLNQYWYEIRNKSQPVYIDVVLLDLLHDTSD